MWTVHRHQKSVPAQLVCRLGLQPRCRKSPPASATRRWTIVGPGAAYERWKKTPEYQQWMMAFGTACSCPRPGAKSPSCRSCCVCTALGGGTAAANLLASDEIQKQHRCVVMAPECDQKGNRWVEHTFRAGRNRAVMPQLMEALNFVIKDAHADPLRIYVTDQSAAG